MNTLRNLIIQEINNSNTKLIELDIYRKPYDLIKTIKINVDLVKNWYVDTDTIESILHNIYSLCPYLTVNDVIEQVKTERFFFTKKDNGCAIVIILREPLSVVFTREFCELLDWSSQSPIIASLLVSFLDKEDLVEFYSQLSCIITNKLRVEKFKYIEECE